MITTQREHPQTDEENKELCDLALQGLHHLSSWNSQIMELVKFHCSIHNAMEAFFFFLLRATLIEACSAISADTEISLDTLYPTAV